MRGRTTVRLALGLAAALGALALVSGGFAAAEEEGGMPPPQKKIEHPFLKDLVGTWDFVADMGKGTSTVRLGLGGTALVEDHESAMGPTPYHGHGLRKVSDDGKTMTLWWFNSFSPEPEVFRGSLGADGYEVRSEQHRITMKKTATGLQLQMFEGDAVLFTSQYTRRGK